MSQDKLLWRQFFLGNSVALINLAERPYLLGNFVTPQDRVLLACGVTEMDQVEYDILSRYLATSKYCESYSKIEKDCLRRRSKTFFLKCTTCSVLHMHTLRSSGVGTCRLKDLCELRSTLLHSTYNSVLNYKMKTVQMCREICNCGSEALEKAV